MISEHKTTGPKVVKQKAFGEHKISPTDPSLNINSVYFRESQSQVYQIVYHSTAFFLPQLFRLKFNSVMFIVLK